MACGLTLAGRNLGCKDSLGGIKKIYIAQFAEGMWEDIASGSVTGLSGTNTASFYQYEMNRGSGSMNQTITASIENGTVFYDQALTANFTKLEASDITELQNITKGRMSVLVQDNNGNWFIMGHKRGVEASGGVVQTGTASGDLNGFTIEMNAQEVAPAPFLAIDATTGEPSDTDITIEDLPT